MMQNQFDTFDLIYDPSVLPFRERLEMWRGIKLDELQVVSDILKKKLAPNIEFNMRTWQMSISECKTAACAIGTTLLLDKKWGDRNRIYFNSINGIYGYDECKYIRSYGFDAIQKNLGIPSYQLVCCIRYSLVNILFDAVTYEPISTQYVVQKRIQDFIDFCRREIVKLQVIVEQETIKNTTNSNANIKVSKRRRQKLVSV